MESKITDDERPSRRTMENYDRSFEDEPRDEKRCNLEIPRWLRANLKAVAKKSGRTMISYLAWTIPDAYGKTRADYEREEREYEEKMRLKAGK